MAALKEPAVPDNKTTDKPVSPPETAQSQTKNGSNGRKPGFISRFRREKEEWLDVTGYLVEGLTTDKPVIIHTDGTVVGHIVAPKVIVKGTITGSAYCHSLEVAATGHILGDVYAVSFTVQPGGKVQGWMSSIDEADLARYRATGTLIDEPRLVSQTDRLPEKLDTGFLTHNESEMESLHLLQLELAAALASRYEMEQDFEKRLTEMAGEAYGKINSLTEQLTAVRSELTGQNRSLDENQEVIRQQKTQIERQSNELTIARELMTDQNQELSELRDLYNDLRHKHTILVAEKAEVDAALEALTKENENYAQRLESLETVHRNNMQYQADQEDSLVRWQELAEVKEKRAAELETQLQKMQFQLEESANTINLLREQRHDLDEELEKALADLRGLQGSKTRPLVDAAALAELTDRITQLETELADAEQEYLEQIIWYKANLESSRSELEAARETAVAQTSQIERLQTEMEEMQATLAQQQADILTWQEKLAKQQETTQWQEQEVVKWQTAVAEKETIWRNQTEELQHTITLLKADKKNMQATLRESQNQLQASEAEVNRYLQETRTQGERLAEIHARLVEREVQLKQLGGQFKQAREMIEKQNQTIKQMKEMASEKIRALQAENVRLQAKGN
ncbi:MAG TPA: polymer-forming cytoskeletal protein [Chloroflexota bacterium]|nr:polymer-forming cytoskeletal protein [Chloroflexota bacterium]